MCSGLIYRFGVIAGRMTCILAVLLLPCASSAHAQVIEEGGFPEKGLSVSGESFSLSCPPRLLAREGESILFSCAATGVSEEGVRYRWESLSGDGLDLLSAPDELSPLFRAPVSGAGAEYAYRLTTVAATFYETATVIVTVEGASSGSVRDRDKPPGLQDECDPFAVPDELGQGCVPWEGAPDAFGLGFEEEGGFLFPEAPGLPDRAGLDIQAPPRLDCPAAVFLEELETGAIECHAWDVSGEEHLEYSWEPVGSTTRDYLDNPRLIPEDSPTPSVIAPEAPVHETLESFRSGETTFRYRYRLTAASRATGLSSHEEIEVYVSSRRPSVYCPLEVVVEEGETITLDCEGVDPLSFRMDYDEEAASVLWEWEGLWGTSTAPLDAADLSSPLFTAPLGSAGEEYHYIASMTTSASGVARTARRRVTVRVVEQETEARLSVSAVKIHCNGTSFTRYAGSDNILLNCWRSGDAVYSHYRWLFVAWRAEGPPQTAPSSGGFPSGFPSPDGLDVSFSPLRATFGMPATVDSDTTYKYTVGIWAGYYSWRSFPLLASKDITITVLKRPSITVMCKQPDSVDEGSSDIELECEADGAPGDNPDYTWSWSPTTRLNDHDTATPAFAVPGSVEQDTTYTYTVTASAANAEDGIATVTVTVLDVPPSIACDDTEVYEGSADITLDCSVAHEPSGASYSWEGRGSTTDTSLLTSGTDGLAPTFSVPYELDAETDYDYTVTLSASGVNDVTEDVTVTVLKRPSIIVACKQPDSVDEGSSDIELECEAGGAPGDNPDYTWSWSPTTRLNDHDTATPAFAVPGSVEQDTTYTYTVTASAANAEDGTATMTVTVLDVPPSIACNDTEVYEGSADITLDCRAAHEPSGASYSWEGRGSTTDTSLLTSGTDGLAPTFSVPDEVGGTNTAYEYAITLSARGTDVTTADITVTVLEKPDILLCGGNRSSLGSTTVWEGSDDFQILSCGTLPTGAPGGNPAYTYAWTARGDTPATAVSLLSPSNVQMPTFLVPDEVNEDKTYEYLLTVSAANADDATQDYTVIVKNKLSITVTCENPDDVYEGSADFALNCEASGAPVGSAYEYVWTARGDTQDTALLSAKDIESPMFYVPDEVAATTSYEYLLTVSAENAEDGSAQVTVTVLNTGTLLVVCTDPGSVYEGSDDVTFDCSASGAPVGSVYEYAWTARGSTSNTDLLSDVTLLTPTFYVPDELDENGTYEYRLTVSAENAENATAEVEVTVLNKPALAVTCTDPGSVYEGSADVAFDCSASGASGDNPNYTYAWAARGDTQGTSLLSAADIASPTFLVPDEIAATTTYEYLLTASAENAIDATAEVSVTVLNKPALAVTCTDPGSVYEGSADVAFDCSASGASGDNPNYTYAWAARGDTQGTSLLSAEDIASPTFLVPDEIAATTTYEYLLTASAENAIDATAEVSVTVLNRGALAVVCADPGSVYEGSADIVFDCEASGAPAGSDYRYVWEARGDTQDTALLSAKDIESPTFYVPDEVIVTTTYEYLLTASADNAEDGSAEVTVTVLNKGSLAVTCADPGSVYEGSEDVAFDCLASGAPGDNPQYTYAWTGRGNTPDVSLLSAADIVSPTFYVPDEVEEDEAYEYLLTVSAENAEDGSAEVTVTVLNRAVAPPSEPVSPPVEEIPVDSPPVASSSSTRASSDPSALGVTVSASPLRFGVQSSDTEVSLDPVTDGISTYVSGPYHGGRMTLAPGGDEALDDTGEMDLSIELASPIVLERADAIGAPSLVLTPNWSYAESCEQLSSQTIGGLYTEVTLSEDDCRLLRFGGEIDLTGVPSGQYTGSLDLVLRSGEREETHTVEVTVTVVPSQRVITIGPGGVRFSTSRELPVALTEDQNLSIYPDVAFLTKEQPHGVFELSNPSLIPLEVSVSARFGYTEATENGREIVVEDASASRLGDLSEVMDIHPGVLVLMPGDKGIIRYGVKEEAHAAIVEKGYAAFFDVVSRPRRYADLDRMPEEVTGDRTARVTMRVPGVYLPGEGASQLRVQLLSISYVGSLSATFLLETRDHPFVGEVVAYDGDGRELGRTETLVYTRSRVRIPLDRMPEEGAVFLRFSPRGSGRAPLPASVEWNALRRDIGAAGEEGRTRPPATLVQKP